MEFYPTSLSCQGFAKGWFPKADVALYRDFLQKVFLPWQKKAMILDFPGPKPE